MFLIWKNALMYVSVKIYMASQSYLEVDDPGWGSVMDQNRENNQMTRKRLLDKGDSANR